MRFQKLHLGYSVTLGLVLWELIVSAGEIAGQASNDSFFYRFVTEKLPIVTDGFPVITDSLPMNFLQYERRIANAQETSPSGRNDDLD